MILEPLISLKFLFSRRRERFFSAAALVALLGVAFGVAALEVALGVTSGLMKEYKRAILSFNSHLILMKADEIANAEEVGASFKNFRALGNVAGWTPFIYREGLLVSGSKVKGIVLKGVDFEKYSDLSRMKIRFFPGNTAGEATTLPTIILGQALADDLQLSPEASPEERTLRILFPRGLPSDKSLTDAIRSFRVGGTFTSGLHEYDSSFAFLSLQEAQTFFQTKGRVSGLEIWLEDPDGAEVWAESLRKAFDYPYVVMTWRDLNENVFRALETERTIFFIIMAVLIAVASLNVMGTLTMLLLEKRKEVAILRALGLTWSRLRKIFLFDGLLIGSAGVAAGLLMGLGVLFFLETWQPIHLAPEVYFVSQVPVEYARRNFVLVVSAAFVILFVGCEVALRRLTRFRDVKTLLENS